MYKITNTYSGEVEIYRDKVIKRYDYEHIYLRERHWLEQLKEFDRTPTIISTKDNEITMTYCGERITKDNLPEDWREQANYIISKLKEFNCAHNDIKPEEILVKDNKLYLVDFGWALEIGEEIPPYFPKGIGNEFSKGIHIFDDNYSIFKSIESLYKGCSESSIKGSFTPVMK